VHSVTKWITSALIPAFVIPNVLKWHWWRFNGYGFFAGMAAGTAAAIVIPGSLPGLHEVFTFLLILAISAIASIGVCLFTRPETDEVLEGFYRNVRPWGLWRPVLDKCRRRNPAFQPNRGFRRDLFNLAVGLVWQTAMVAAPIYLVIQHWRQFWVALAIFVATSAVLKYTWYDTLAKGDGYLSDEVARR
jgi:solute:Na+ symporter, SSS family